VPEADVQKSETAVKKAIPILEHSGEYWFKNRQCISCHHHALMQVTEAVVKDLGFKTNQKLTLSRNQKIEARLELTRFDRLEGFGSINGNSTFPYAAWGEAAAGMYPNDNTDSTVILLLQKQSESGNWPSYSHRPPLEDSSFTATSMAIKTLQVYTPSEFRRESKIAVDRATRWLRAAHPQSNEDAAFQIMGLVWGHGPAQDVQTRVASLLRMQNQDGGWSQIPRRPSDAYATGESLIALYMGGIPTTHPAFQNGIRYLLATQKRDGTWLVPTRRVFPGLPYFESGFPHGKHQFISFAGTCWATMALAINAKRQKPTALLDTKWRGDNARRGSLAKSPNADRLLKAALWGKVSDVESALSTGVDVNAKSLGGATALAYAVRSPEKVSFLITKGADVNAKSFVEATPFLLAAEYSGSDQPFLQMLHKANLKLGAGQFFGPIGMAASTNSQGRLKTLIEAGAAPDIFQLVMAYTCHQYGNLEYLCKQNIDLERPTDEFKSTILIWAIQDGSAEGVDILLRNGANPNATMSSGLTALMIAAMVDYGNGAIVEDLLKHGATADLKTSDGKTAWGLAKKYNNISAIKSLEKWPRATLRNQRPTL
jgi:N-acyl-D-amino-acid deacylase